MRHFVRLAADFVPLVYGWSCLCMTIRALRIFEVRCLLEGFRFYPPTSPCEPRGERALACASLLCE